MIVTIFDLLLRGSLVNGLICIIGVFKVRRALYEVEKHVLSSDDGSIVNNAA